MYTVTSAQRAMSDDIAYRRRRYLISMGIRTACVPLIVILPSPWRWVVAAGAIFIPYIAVVFANGGREPDNSARFEPYEGQDTPDSGDKSDDGDDTGRRPEIPS